MIAAAHIDLYRGDCLDVMRRLPAASVDLVLADLPYGTTACKWDEVIPFAALWDCYRRILKPRGAVVLTACQPFTSRLVMSNPKWFKGELIWEKTVPTGFLDANRRPLRAHENVLVFAPHRPTYNPQMTEGEPYTVRRKPRVVETLGAKRATALNWDTVNTGTRFPRTVIRVSNRNGGGKSHPTEKPVALMEWLIRTYSHPGEIVLDNVMGGGTTGVAAVNAGRRFVGIERDRDYYETAGERIRAAAKAAA